VQAALELAQKYKLTAEVVCWALKHAKNFPSASIEECIGVGLADWIK